MCSHSTLRGSAKTIENRFDEVSNENKERAKLSVSKRRQTTIFSEDHEVGIPSPQWGCRTKVKMHKYM